MNNENYKNCNTKNTFNKSYDEFLKYYTQNPQHNFSEYVEKNELIDYIHNNPIKYESQNKEHFSLVLKSEIFEILFKNNNTQNLTYILDAGFNVNHVGYIDHTVLIDILIYNCDDERILEQFMKIMSGQICFHKSLKNLKNSDFKYNFHLNPHESVCFKYSTQEDYNVFDEEFPTHLFKHTMYCFDHLVKNKSIEFSCKLIDLLIFYGIRPNIKNKNGDTALHLFIKRLFGGCFNELMNAPSVKKIINKYQFHLSCTNSCWAMSSETFFKFFGIIEHLKKYDTDEPDNYGYTVTDLLTIHFKKFDADYCKNELQFLNLLTLMDQLKLIEFRQDNLAHVKNQIELSNKNIFNKIVNYLSNA